MNSILAYFSLGAGKVSLENDYYMTFVSLWLN